MGRGSGDITYAQTQDMIEAARREASANTASAASIGGFSDLTPIGPWPVSIRQFKGKAFVTLKVAVPAGTVRLKTVLEQYTGAGPTVTVVKRINDVDQELPDSIGTIGGVFTFEFGIGLSFNANYGCPKLVAIMSNGTRVVNPIPDVPESTRLLTDYLPSSTFTLGDAFGALSAPNTSLITYNSLDPITPDIYDAHAGLKILAPTTDAGAAQSWGAFLGANQTATVQAIISRDYGPDGVINTPYPHTLNDTELTQVDPTSTPANRGFVVVEANKLIPGGQYTWIENKINVNGEKKTATGSAAFVAANFSTDITQLTNLALSVIGVDPFDGKHVQPFLELTQPWPNPVALKNYTVKLKKSSVTNYNIIVHRGLSVQSEALHLQLNAGTISITSGLKAMTGVGTFFTRLQEGWKIKQGAQTFIIESITDDTHLTTTVAAGSTVTTQAYTVVCVIPLVSSMKVKVSTTYNLQVILRARGITVVTLNLTFTTTADGNVIVDTGVPILATPQTIDIVEHDGIATVTAPYPDPTTNANTVDECQWVMSSRNTPPAATPVKGSEGVRKIGYDRTHEFTLPRPFPVGISALYFYYRWHNKSGVDAGGGAGYSAWSTDISVFLTSTGVSRPLIDIIGTDAPVMAERLEIASTSGVGHTSTTFILGSDASSVDNFYQNMIIHLPNFSSGTAPQKRSNVKIITFYNGTTKACTVVTFEEIPVGAVPYEIHKISIDGDRAGGLQGGSTTTTLILPLSDTRPTDYYKGFTVYIPTQPTADKLRKIIAYNGTTKVATLETAVAAAALSGQGFILINGSFGWTNTDKTGILSPVPFRHWLDGVTDRTIIQFLFPTDENAFSLAAFQARRHRGNATGNILEDTGIQAIAPATTWSFQASNLPVTSVIEFRIQNYYRASGSDGWSARTSYVEVQNNAAGGGIANYDPDNFSLIISDFHAQSAYPTRYQST
jgi:hypothetical protein